jgi:glyoxylase I family protein
VADGSQNPGVTRHIAFQTNDLNEFLTRVGNEITISLGPLSFDDFIPGWRSAWLIDPDGVIVEVRQGYRYRGEDPATIGKVLAAAGCVFDEVM